MNRIANALGKLIGGKSAPAAFVLCAATAIALPAQTFTTLHNFDAPGGAAPYAGLVQATNGDLYGTTACCGANSSAGTVFKTTPNGTLTTLYNFCAQSGCTDGIDPVAGLVQATNGDLYGTTAGGGVSCGGDGCGTIFKITQSGTLTTLYSFTGGADGLSPRAPLIQATNGDLYGTTSSGGAGTSPVGTVFKMTLSGTLTTLYSFCSQSACTDGVSPNGLIQSTNGNLYGTTANGGTNCSGGGCGTVFKMTPSGTLTTLYSFCSQLACTDGAYPAAGLIQATDGNFYGTTGGGGATGNGTVFKITPSGKLTTLYNFCSQSGCTDGTYPVAGLVQATDGDFYGTTYYGGANSGFMPRGAGTLFKITPRGALTTLYNFCSQSSCTDGDSPWAGLVQATNGEFYGTTVYCGVACTADGWGTVFRLSVGLGPFVETQTTSGKVGARVKILGNNLTHASSVTFNGTVALFTASASEIAATVPIGATTGIVQVVTPGGTLSSNVPFRVLP